MKRTARTVAALSFVVACAILASCGAPDESESLSESQQELDAKATRNLTATQGMMNGVTDEAARESDTDDYYLAVRTGNDGVGGATAARGLRHFYDFKVQYGFFDGSEKVATYYNRGDLGIGREMHCVDKLSTTGQVACYVKNFAAGDDNTPFTFGLSHDIAFKNMQTGSTYNYFATVAMVYRKQATVDNNKVFFLVYNNDETLVDSAALDRVGIAYNTAFHAKPQGSLVGLGTPGVNFNNHIPSNCISCHGGQPYNSTNGKLNPGVIRNEIGTLFLPFDLDQFDYNADNPRDAQEPQFLALNQIVRNVAVDSGSDMTSSLANQIDGWYGNVNHLPTLTGKFNSNYLPPGWDPSHTPDTSKGEVRATPGAPAVYRNVVRGACRNCHVVNDRVDSTTKLPDLHFDTEANFITQLPRAALDIKAFVMPHSLQSVRNFWQSSQSIALRNYAAGLGTQDGNKVNTALQGAGPANVATLDPPALLTTLVH